MTEEQIITTYKQIISALFSKKLKSAFEYSKQLTDELQIVEYADRRNDIEQNYNFLLHYFSTGVKDPQGKIIYNQLIARTLTLASDIQEELLTVASGSIEFVQKRNFIQTKKQTEELYNKLCYYYAQTEFFSNSVENHDIETNRLRTNYEAILPNIFNIFWLSNTIQLEEKTLFNNILKDEKCSDIEKSLIVSALTLNLWRKFDESKLMLLFDCCTYTSQQVKQRALVAICFVCAKYQHYLAYFPAVRNRLILLTDEQNIVENIKQIITQVIFTKETDKIAKKLKEEILPEVMKISPMLKNKIDTENLVNLDEWQNENPEWQDIIEKSGVSEKLQELNELQLEGADVYMSTFSLLKGFPFFTQTCNWLMPFDTKSMSINKLFLTNNKTLLSAFINNPLLCNSDKYSFCLSLLQMPESQRQLINQSFGAEAEKLEEMSKDEALLTPNTISKNISKQYIQDLFRFFKLHPQHAEFENMFDFSLQLHHSFIFEVLKNDLEFCRSIAEYYFSKSHYLEALELFEIIKTKSEPTAELYQKIGYSNQQTSQFTKALAAYAKADIIQPDDNWTVRKLAICYRLMGDYNKALENYQHANYLKPNDTNIMLQIANCYMEMGNYPEALNIYFKLDAENDGNIKVWRALTWCSFISHNMEKAKYYSIKTLTNNPNAHDYLNAGHIAWCERKINDTQAFYKKSIELSNYKTEAFLKSFDEDKSHLIANGIEEDEIAIMMDMLLYS